MRTTGHVRRHARIVLCLSASMSLCSCAAPQRVVEADPPSVRTPVRVELDPRFSATCAYAKASTSGHAQRPRPQSDVHRLHTEQDRLLTDQGALSRRVRIHIGNATSEMVTALAALDADSAARWDVAAEEAYHEILRTVLTHKQRNKHRRMEDKKKDREDIVARLSLTDHQKQQMTAIYLAYLQTCHNARAASQVFAASTHRQIDKLLHDMERFGTDADWVSTSYRQIDEAVTSTDRNYRDAAREVGWLEAALETEEDAKEKIRLRKQIVDKRADAESLRVAAEEQARVLSAYTWRIDELLDARRIVLRDVQMLHRCHDVYRQALDAIALLNGRMSDDCDRQYNGARRALGAALMEMRGHAEYLTDDVVRELDNVLREKH